tara:strand:- start:1282 stop:1434 length:153 start_codon:yes stop_codon:yes gene_type:complete
MKKKFFLITICFLVFVSCGKKSDPEYKAEKNSVNNENYIFESQKVKKIYK